MRPDELAWRFCERKGASPFRRTIAALDSKTTLRIDHCVGKRNGRSEAQFAWWAGSSQKDARAGIEGLKLKPVSVTGWAEEAWIEEERLDSLVRQSAALHGRLCIFLPFRDNYQSFRRGLAPFLAARAQKRKVLDSRNREVALGELESLHHNAIVLQGRLVGLWEYDPEEERVVWSTLEDMPATSRKTLAIAIEDLEDFIRAELGDVRLYSIDTGAKRRDRINSVKSA